MRNVIKLLLVGAIFCPTAVFGACQQSDLTGTWRFNINTGGKIDNANRTDMLSCIIGVSATGAFSVRACETLNATGHTGTITINSPQRTLRVAPGCEVRLAGQPVFTNDLDITVGNTMYFANEMILSMSGSRDFMLGYASVAGMGAFSISAVKRRP